MGEETSRALGVALNSDMPATRTPAEGEHKIFTRAGLCLITKH